MPGAHPGPAGWPAGGPAGPVRRPSHGHRDESESAALRIPFAAAAACAAAGRRDSRARAVSDRRARLRLAVSSRKSRRRAPYPSLTRHGSSRSRRPAGPAAAGGAAPEPWPHPTTPHLPCSGPWIWLWQGEINSINTGIRSRAPGRIALHAAAGPAGGRRERLGLRAARRVGHASRVTDVAGARRALAASSLPPG